jgi:hypothetical protein
MRTPVKLLAARSQTAAASQLQPCGTPYLLSIASVQCVTLISGHLIQLSYPANDIGHSAKTLERRATLSNSIPPYANECHDSFGKPYRSRRSWKITLEQSGCSSTTTMLLFLYAHPFLFRTTSALSGHRTSVGIHPESSDECRLFPLPSAIPTKPSGH